MKSALVIIDMQNDFITGSLANENAQRIVKPLCEFIKENKQQFGCVAVTRDTHGPNYLDTREGTYLPVEHCVKNTAGWCVCDELMKTLRDVKYWVFFDKSEFSAKSDLTCFVSDCDIIYVCGTVSEICVVSNALMLRNALPEARIIVLEDLCAGLSDEGHKAAMTVLKACHCDVIQSSEAFL